jgi:hypothetical protein
MKVADVPLDVMYKLTDRDGGANFTKYYRFKSTFTSAGTLVYFRVYRAACTAWFDDLPTTGDHRRLTSS